MTLSLSKKEAKRIAIRAQGLSGQRPTKQIEIDDVHRSIRAMGLLQIDSVNVCVRSHYMPLFSRLGVYDQDLLDRLAYEEKAVFETWAHAAVSYRLKIIDCSDRGWQRMFPGTVLLD